MTARFFAQSWLSGMLRFPISRHFPQGIHLARDIRRFFPDQPMHRILDVGANEGQSAIQLALAFPKARIDSFEPAAETYRTLVRRVAWTQRIRCHQVALGASCGTSTMMTDTDHSSSFRLTEDGGELVTTTTVARFCADHEIGTVDLLKVDTEGHDLEVLRGAEDLLERQRIDLLQVEAGMNRENALHVHFEELTRYLGGFGYRLFGIYDQSHEWPTGSPNLRRANLAFLSGKRMYGTPLAIRW